MTKGSKTASYTYDMSGVRSSKTVNGVSYEYTTLSGKITRMTWSGNAVDIVYDDAGRPYLLRYTPSGGATQTYYYVLNLQGDVVGLMNTSMQMVVKYSYDPWGKLTGTTATSAYVALAQANPLRYRSYCYDIETGFYYLQTRYYDPTIARFINADGYLSTDSTGLLSYNMFAYCENNPVMCVDQDGNSSKWWPFIRDFRYGLIHTMVQLKIQQSCTLIQTEAVTVNNKRMDLYCEQLHMVWEVKPDSKSAGVIAARMSLCKYIGNQARDCKHVPKNVVGVGPCGVFKGSFVFEYGSTKYAVWYWTPEAGVVLYDFEPIGDDETVEEYVIERLTAYASHRSVSYSPVGQYGDGGAYASSFLNGPGPAVIGAAAVGCAVGLFGGRAQMLNECR